MFSWDNISFLRIEDLENIKMKLQARLAECQGTVENLNSKLIQLEKSKAQIQVIQKLRAIDLTFYIICISESFNLNISH